MSQPPFEIALAQRWFAVEFNNRAWDLVEQCDRSDDETVEMLHAAHAAAIHWQAVGTKLHAQRAENLLATAYLQAGHSEPALFHAKRGLALGEQNAADQTPFDQATTFAAAARAYELAGNRPESQRLSSLALAAAERLPADDQAVFDKLYGSNPR